MEKLNLEATKIFCNILNKLTDKNNITLQSSGMINLDIEKIDDPIDTSLGTGKLYTVSETYVQNGKALSAIEMGFIVVDNRTNETDYLLISIYPQMYRAPEHDLDEESITIEKGKVKSYIKKWQLSHCRSANKWMREIRSGGFLK